MDPLLLALSPQLPVRCAIISNTYIFPLTNFFSP